jgi:hypothetical protein
MYNKFMGVDLMDSLIALYHTSIWSKKWYLKIVFHLMDLVVVSAGLLNRRDCKSCGMSKKEQMSLLQFKASVAVCLCQQNKEKQKKYGRPSSSSLEHQLEEKKRKRPVAPMPDKELRQDEVSHWPQLVEKRERCKKPGCAGIPSDVYEMQGPFVFHTILQLLCDLPDRLVIAEESQETLNKP